MEPLSNLSLVEPLSNLPLVEPLSNLSVMEPQKHAVCSTVIYVTGCFFFVTYMSFLNINTEYLHIQYLP